MKNGRKLSNRILAILLSIVLSVGTFYGDYALTRAEEIVTETQMDSASESTEEAPATEDNDVAAPAEGGDTFVSEESVATSTEEAIQSEESAVSDESATDETAADETAADETAAEESAADETAVDETAADETAEETLADETAETVADETAEDVSDNDIDDISGNDVSDNDVEEEVAYDLEFRESVEIDGLRITLYAAPDILPNDARLDVKKVSYTLARNAEKAIDEATGDNVEVVESYTYDITIQSATLGEVQPKNGTVSLTFEEVVDESEAVAGTELSVYHVNDNGNQVSSVEQVGASAKESTDITVETAHFSTYTVVLKQGKNTAKEFKAYLKTEKDGVYSDLNIGSNPSKTITITGATTPAALAAQLTVPGYTFVKAVYYYTTTAWFTTTYHYDEITSFNIRKSSYSSNYYPTFTTVYNETQDADDHTVWFIYQKVTTPTEWYRTKEDNTHVVTLSDYDKLNWNWDKVKNLSLDLHTQEEVWDGNYDNYYTDYSEGKITKDYDFATWTHYTKEKNKATVRRFQKTYTIPEGYDASDFFSLTNVAHYTFNGKEVIPINDDVYIFVYKKGENITNQNFKNYLAFWTGTSCQSGLKTFQGVTGTTSIWARHEKDSKDNSAAMRALYATAYEDLKYTDGWFCEVGQDNIGTIMSTNYPNAKAGDEFIIDVFAVDYSAGGGMSAFDVTATANLNALVNVKYYKDSVSDANLLGTKISKDYVNTWLDLSTIGTNAYKPANDYKDGVVVGVTDKDGNPVDFANNKIYVANKNSYTVNVVYAKQNVNYTVKYLKKGTTESVHTPLTDSAPIGSRITKTAITVEGYILDGASSQTIEKLDRDPSKNVITFYYVPSTVTITWMNEGETNPLRVDENVTYGSMPSYGSTPVKKSSDEYEYTFKAWTPAIVAATQDATYTATYTQTKRSYAYTVNHILEGSTKPFKTVNGQTAQFGTTVTAQALAAKDIPEGYKVRATNTYTVKITADVTKNVINIYYDQDLSKTKTLAYEINYYVVGTKQTDDCTSGSKKVWINSSETFAIPAPDTDDKKYTGYQLGDIKVNNVVVADASKIPTSVSSSTTANAKTTIDIYYVKNANWTKKGSLFYTVEYYKDGVKVDADTHTETQNYEVWVLDPVPTTLNVVAKNINTTNKYEGYTFEKTDPATLPAKIANKGVIKVYYKVNKHQVSYKYVATPSTIAADRAVTAAEAATLANLPGTTTGVAFGSTFTVAATPSVDGYDFYGWSKDGATATSFQMPDSDVTLQGYFVRKTNISYKVEHYYQNLDGSYPSKAANDDIKTYTGITGASVSVTNEMLQNKAGFTHTTVADLSKERGTIAGDGSLVLKVYYARNSYTVTYKYTGSIPTGASAPVPSANAQGIVSTKTYKYGENVSVQADATASGYTFSGWTVSADAEEAELSTWQQIIDGIQTLFGVTPAQQFAMPATDIVVSGSFAAETSTYSIEYYQQNVAQNGYVLVEDETLTNLSATTDTTVSVSTQQIKSFEGFTHVQVEGLSKESGVVTAANNLVLKVYYNRNSYEVSYSYKDNFQPEGAADVPKTATVVYGKSVTVAQAASADGYTFSGWATADAAVENGAFVMPAKNVAFTGSFVPNENTQYKIEVYLQNVNDDDYTIKTFDDGTTAKVRTGTTGTAASVNGLIAEFTETGFHPASNAMSYYRRGKDGDTKVTSPIITGNGDLVIKLYYDRYVYNVSYGVKYAPSYAPAAPATVNYRYGASVTVASVPSVDGWNFEGWTPNADGFYKQVTISNNTFTMPNGPVLFEGVYSVKFYDITRNYYYENKTDENGAYVKIADSNKIRVGYKKEAYSVGADKTIAGYTVVESPKSITLDPNDTTKNHVDFFYRANQIGYTVKHVRGDITDKEVLMKDADGNDAIETGTKAYESTLNASAKSFTGYSLATGETASRSITMGLSAADNVIVFKYVPNEYPYTVYYKEQGTGKTLANATTGTGKYTYTVTVNAKNITGYSVVGDSSQNIEINLSGNEATFYYKANNYNYTIRYWDRATNASVIDENGNAVADTTGSAAFNSSVIGTAPAVTGYTAEKATDSMVIKTSGNVLTLWYNKNAYDVTYAYTAGTTTKAPDLPESDEGVVYRSTYNVKDAGTLAGYTFSGWFLKEDLTGNQQASFAMPAKNVTLYGTYTANSNTKYKVEHYTQNLPGSTKPYDLYKTDEKTGKTDTEVTAVPYDIDGFTLDKTVTGTVEKDTVAGDGSTVLKLYYTRNKYSVTYKYTGTIPTGVSAPSPSANAQGIVAKDSYYFGQSFELKAKASATGYTFNGWTVSADVSEAQQSKFAQVISAIQTLFGKDPVQSYDMPATNLVVSGYFTANTNTGYKVEYYWQNVAQNGYELHETVDNLTATTDTNVSAEIKTYEGFTHVTVANLTKESGTVAGDGSLVLKVYYNRNQYDVTYSYTKTVPGASALPQKASVVFGKEVNVAAIATAPGYSFGGWLTSDATVKNGKFTMPAKNVAFTGTFTANTNTKYIVEVYQQNITDDNYTQKTFADGKKYVELKGTTESDLPISSLQSQNLDTGFKVRSDNSVVMVKRNAQGAETSYTGTTLPGTGDLVIKLYYDRLTATVSYSYGYADQNNKPSNPPAAPETATYRYGATVSVADALSLDGWTFTGWNLTAGGVTIKNGQFTIGTSNVTFYGSFAADTYDIVRNYYYANKKNTDGSFKKIADSTVLEDVTYTESAVSVAAEKTIEGYTIDQTPKSLTIDPVNTDNNHVDFFFTPNKYDYTVRYLDRATKQPVIDENGKAVANKVVKDAEFDASYTEDSIEVTGYTAEKAKDSITINKTEGNELIFWYNMNKYTVTYAYTKGTVAKAPKAPADVPNVTYRSTFYVTDATKLDGYTFSGWFLNENLTGDKQASFAMPAKNVTLYGTYTANKNTAYKVEHYTQNLPGATEAYSLFKTDELTGTTDSEVTATPYSIEGFTLDKTVPGTVEKDNVAGDGSTVLKLYYVRNQYNVSYKYDHEAGTPVAGSSTPDPTEAALATLSKNYYYGQDVTIIDAATATGYSFNGWAVSTEYVADPAQEKDSSLWAKILESLGKLTGNDVGKTFAMPAGSVEISGSFTADDVNYIVEHYFQNTELDTDLATYEKNEQLAKTEKKSGKADAEATFTAKTFSDGIFINDADATAFVSRNGNTDTAVETTTILPDGTLVIKLYYTRKTPAITYVPVLNDGSEADSALFDAMNPDTYTYGVGIQRLKAANYEGAFFLGWYADAYSMYTVETPAIAEDATDDKTFYAVFAMKVPTDFLLTTPATQDAAYPGDLDPDDMEDGRYRYIEATTGLMSYNNREAGLEAGVVSGSAMLPFKRFVRSDEVATYNPRKFDERDLGTNIAPLIPVTDLITTNAPVSTDAIQVFTKDGATYLRTLYDGVIYEAAYDSVDWYVLKKGPNANWNVVGAPQWTEVGSLSVIGEETVYDAANHTVTVEGAENGTLSYKVTTADAEEPAPYSELPQFVDAGTYHVEVTATFGQFTLTDDADVVITPREVTIQSLSARKTFDGSPLVANDRVMLTAVVGDEETVSYEALKLTEDPGIYEETIFPGEGEGIEVVVTGSIVRDEGVNTFTVRTANLKDNYILKAIEGDLLVISRNEEEDNRIEITLTGVTATYTYDGNEHAANGYTIPDMENFEASETIVEYAYEYDHEKAKTLTDLYEVGYELPELEEEPEEPEEEENLLSRIYRLFAPMSVQAVDVTGYDNIPEGAVVFSITNTEGVQTIYAVTGVKAYVAAVNVGTYVQEVDASDAQIVIVEKDVDPEEFEDVTDQFSFLTANGKLIINAAPSQDNPPTTRTTRTGEVLGVDREVTIADEEVPKVLGADRPQTGDDANAFAWIFAMATAAMIFGYSIFKKKKEDEEEA